VTVRGVSIREAKIGDLAGVMAIERASFSDPWSAEAFETSVTLERFRFLVAESAEEFSLGEMSSPGAPRLAGYVIALLLGSEGEVADLAVDPEIRGQGIGARLLDAVLDRAQSDGVRTFYLEVRESNESARRLYNSRSFVVVGRRRGYYQQPPEDALVLRRDAAPT
jgi:ribosomal-protein-alanine N-acetyltransferase